MLLEFEESQQQVAQRGHDKSPRAPADSGSVFAQTDIAAVVGAVFAGAPVVPDALEQLPGTVLPGSGAGAVESVFLGGGDDFAGAQFLALAPDGQELPATAQARFFGAQADALQPPTHQAPVFLEPAGVVFSGKKSFRQPDLRPLQNALLIAFEAEEIISPQFPGDEAAALLLAMQGIGGDEAAFQRPLGQLAQQRLEGGDLVALFLNGLLRHPVLVVETFVDPEQFCGTVYTANGWEELGRTDGSGRHQRDYYVRHDKPKRLFVRELRRSARRSLQAEHLQPALSVVEAKVGPRSRHTTKEIKSIVDYLKQAPEYRQRVESYPLWSLLAIYLLAVLCGAPRGSKDLAKFARKLSQPQRRTLGIRPRHGRYPAPSQPTFWRLLQEIDGTKLQQILLAVQERLRGPAPKDELIALDGKEPKHGGGQSVLTAICVPSLYYLDSAIVDTKTNEIPVARQLFEDLDLRGRFVSLDALHTQTQTARDIVLEGGGDYLLTAKDNQPTVHQNIQKLVPAPKADFPPLEAHAHGVSDSGCRKEPVGEPLDPNPVGLSGADWLSVGGPGGPAVAPKPGPKG
jgi:predicted transposase YbfD/YdcC